jgi:hypothetical protein
MNTPLFLRSPDRRNCNAIKCGETRGKTEAFCPTHWVALPRRLKLELIESYESGQSGSNGIPNTKWVIALRRAINWIAVHEGRMTLSESKLTESKVREATANRDRATLMGDFPPSVG